MIVACALLSSAAAMSCEKNLVLIRHGVSEMNVALSRRPWGSRGFVDPGIFDAPLTPRGEAQARGTKVAEAVDLVVSSPLTRALQTTTGVFGEERLGSGRAIALPLAAERVYLSSDVGKRRSELAADWGNLFDFGEMEEETWWYAEATEEEWRPRGTYLCPGEPSDAFMDRMRKLTEWIEGRPEATIAVVCHWGVINTLTGMSFQNCQVKKVPMSQVSVREPPS